MSNTKTIAKNTGWYGVEGFIDQVLTLLTSIAIARYLGPEKAAYIQYVLYLSAIVGSLGSVGLPATLRKYMAEFLGKGDKGTARYIFFRTLFLQAILSSLATAGIVLYVRSYPTAELRLAGLLIALSILPQMINSIPAQANVAAEDLSRNMPASAISILVFFLSVTATVIFHWGVVGVGASVLACRGLDFLIRFIPTFRWIHSWETADTYPEDLRRRAVEFAVQSLILMGLGLVVWDRSEFLLLKLRCADIRQIAFYSVAFNMANRLLIPSTIFGSATGATIFAQFGRDDTKVPGLAVSAFRYLALTSIPIHTVFTALAIPVLLILYGGQYTGAEAVVLIAPLLCMSKAFLSPVQSLLQSFERQRWIIAVTVFAGAIDLGLAWILIPAHGAVGACIANGVAQFTAVALLWGIAIHLFKIRLPWRLIVKITFISAVAGLAGYFCVRTLALNSLATAHGPHWLRAWIIGALAVSLCALVSLLVLLSFVYLFRILQEQDRGRLHQVAGMLPSPLRAVAKAIVAALIRTKPTPVTATNAALF